MKILLVTPDLHPGGAQVAMVRLASGLAGTHEVFVFSLSKPAPGNYLRAQLQKAGASVFSGPFHGIIERVARRLGLLGWLQRRQLRRLKKSHSIEIVNGHLVQAELAACQAFADDPVPLIGTDHGCYRALLKPVSGLGRKEHFAAVFRRSDGLVCPSQSNVDVAARHGWKPGFCTWKIYYGYPLPAGSDLSRSRKSEAPVIFGMVARGIAEKGWTEAVEAFHRVRHQIPVKAVLRLAGEGAAVEQLHRQLSVQQLEDVEFLGHVDDVPALLREVDIGLLPTWFELESLPNTVIEYLASGVPVIATPVGGIPEMLMHQGETAGIIVSLDEKTGRADMTQLIAAMKRLASDSSLREKLSQTALAAAAKFDLKRTVREYTSAFAEAARKAA